MKPEDIPEGDRIYPGEKCIKCGKEIEIYDHDGDDVYLSCPDGEGDDGHTEYSIKAEYLKYYGWKIDD